MSLDRVGVDSTSPLFTPPSFQDDDDPVQNISDYVDNFFNAFMGPFPELPLIDFFEERGEELPAEVLSMGQALATSQQIHLIAPSFSALHSYQKSFVRFVKFSIEITIHLLKSLGALGFTYERGSWETTHKHVYEQNISFLNHFFV